MCNNHRIKQVKHDNSNMIVIMQIALLLDKSFSRPAAKDQIPRIPNRSFEVK